MPFDEFKQDQKVDDSPERLGSKFGNMAQLNTIVASNKNEFESQLRGMGTETRYHEGGEYEEFDENQGGPE